MAIHENTLEYMESKLTPEAVAEARRLALAESFRIKLIELRRQADKTQRDFSAFSQTSVARLEKRRDWKLSTLLEFADDLDMSIEIRARPRHDGKVVTLLKS